MRVIIKPENKERLITALKDGEGRARCRLMSYDDLMAALHQLEEALELLPKKYQINATAWLNTGDTVSKAYKNTANRTAVKVRRCSSGWALEKVSREYTPIASTEIPPYRRISCIELTKEQADRALNAWLGKHRITINP